MYGGFGGEPTGDGGANPDAGLDPNLDARGNAPFDAGVGADLDAVAVAGIDANPDAQSLARVWLHAEPLGDR